MQIPQKELFRQISTSDIEELARFQYRKNRRYIQMQPGSLKGAYLEANLGEVQIFRESLNAGARIEAAPASIFLPFAAISPTSGNYRFCGQQGKTNTVIQASGGEWDISFNNRLNYVCTAFNREYFQQSFETLTGCSLPQAWLVSQISTTLPINLKAYYQGVNCILNKIEANPTLLKNASLAKLLRDESLQLTLNALLPTTLLTEKIKSQPKRIRGVHRVIEYLQVHAAQLPSLQTLCQIAQLSERSLEYGFKDYLNVTPIQYLRLVRLNGARRDLLQADNRQTNVADIALKWGFLEFGRFAGEYRQLFNELPSTTIRAKG